MDFLFEIGLEEVPARMIAAAEAELLRRTVAMLERERLLLPGAARAFGFSTPRRLAVLVAKVAERQADVEEELLGPATKIAFKDGVPGPAAVAFARKAGVPVEELRVVETPKGEYIAATAKRAGRPAAEVIAAELPKELAAIYWAKNMYWRAGKPERFVRPVRWMVALLGTEVVPVEFGGYEAGRVTYGHRVLYGPRAIELGEPAEYAAALERASVLPDVESRRHRIRKALDRVCRTVEGTLWREDHALVDKMTHMTEWPTVIAGAFEPAYLTLPEEVLVTVMRDHQNYFAVETKDGKLAPHFLAVLNTEATPEGEAVIRHGNERVLRARFNDARFFWDFDQRVSLEGRIALLEDITFQQDLGSYFVKSQRVQAVACTLREAMGPLTEKVEWSNLDLAIRLAKTDLTTELVKEFTELQGQVGGLYARAQGHPDAVCDAIYDQYRPASMDDRIPRTPEGQMLSIVDRVDTIAGMFGLGMEPTGSKDPFALRRAANGIVRIVAESELNLALAKICAAARPAADVQQKMMAFFAERVEFYLREARGQAYDVVKAVMAAGWDDLADLIARAEAVTDARGSADFLAVSAAFKRMKNIVAQARTDGASDGSTDESSVPMPAAQEALMQKSMTLGLVVRQMAAKHEYREALKLIGSLRPEIDAFFDQVMVLDPNLSVRMGRVALLQNILRQFSQVADFSEIVVAG